MELQLLPQILEAVESDGGGTGAGTGPNLTAATTTGGGGMRNWRTVSGCGPIYTLEQQVDLV